MKKLLSLLSILTISGTAMPSVIAVSSYEKENLKLESNLENLHRIKRGNDKKKKIQKNRTSAIDEEDDSRSSTSSRNNNRCGNSGGGRRNQRCRRPNENNSEITTKIGRERILGEIESNSNNIFEDGKQENKYKVFIKKSIDYFKETNNIVEETKHPDKNWTIYKLEKHNVEDSYKKIPLNIEGKKIDLILNKSNLYVDGIITYNNGSDGIGKSLWYFKDSNLHKNYQSLKSSDKYKLFSKILNAEINSDQHLNILINNLNFDSNYNTLKSGDENIKINKETIRIAINNLSSISDNKIKTKQKEIKKDFLRTIFITSEATRFFSIRQEANKILTSSDNYEVNWQYYYEKLTKWDQNSQKYYEMKDGKEFDDEEKEKIYDISVLAVKDDQKIRKDNDNRKK